MRFFSELFRCKSILCFSYPSQFVPDPFISLSVLFVDNQIRFVSSHFFSNAPQTEPLISHSYQINSMPIRVSANPIFSLSVRFRSTAVQIDPFIGFSGRFGTSPTRLRSLPFLGSSGEFYAFPPRIPATPSHLVANQLQFRPTRLFSAPFRFLAIVSIPRLLVSNLFHFPSIRSSSSSSYRHSAVPQQSVRFKSFSSMRYFLFPAIPCLCTSLRILSPRKNPAVSAAASAWRFFRMDSRSPRYNR